MTAAPIQSACMLTAPEQVQTPPPTATAFAVVASLGNPVVPMLAAPAKPLETLTTEAPVEVQ